MSQDRIPSSIGAGPYPPPTLFKDGYWRYKRFYGNWREGKYLIPIDLEELSRMDIFHKVFLVARDNRPFNTPLNRRNPKIMDLGTGTGIWPIALIEERYVPDAEIMMVDINAIQPALIPPGITPMHFDMEEPNWDHLMMDCDFIHMRMLLGSIQTDLWPQIYRNILEHLAPGIGHVEHVEIDWEPRLDEGEVDINTAYRTWARLYQDGMDRIGRSARVATHDAGQMLEEAGFIDVKEEVTKFYICPWSEDRHAREIARWFNLGLTGGLSALSLVPLIEQFGMSEEAIARLCATAKEELCNLNNHAYCTMHIWTARRPAPQ